MSCLACLGANCLDDLGNKPNGELYSLNDGSIYFNDAYCFVLSCPQGYICSGAYPRTICIDPNTLPPIVVPPGATQASINCCQKTLFATIPAGASGPQIAAIVQQLFADCARQQAYCDLINTGSGGFPPPRRNPHGGSNRLPMQFTGYPGTGCVGGAYSTTIRILGGDGAVLLGLVSGHLPPGLSPSTSVDGNSFILSGTPTQAGTFTFTISAQDSIGNIQKTFTVVIRGISNFGTIPDGMENTAYSYQLTSTGGMAPYTYTMVLGSIPGIILSSSGLLSGTPDYATAGDYPFQVRTTDAAGQTCLANGIFHISLRPGPDWTQLTWPTYTLVQGGVPSSCSGGAIANSATGSLNWAGNPPFVEIDPVQSSGILYTGPSVTARIRVTVAFTGPGGNTMAAEIKRNGVQIGSYGQPMTSGTHDFDIVIPISAGDTYTIDDIGGGNHWAICNGVGSTASLSFTWTIFNL